ncbi:hypothetical protein [Oceanobacillus kimchii]|uniref:Uncharacterized protein n=1 Tax=Oceanobacillus kimchii TaxID=746691 RepID=A0ABQ5TKP8_9BACI|nr:hypothetical protein [Oceanobacillus kimchii]GLO66154.1 hypothetical protein MACH08_19380 [Oceanobacillus kimchii]
MGSFLQNQVHIYSLDTSAFYSHPEKEINQQIIDFKIEKRELKQMQSQENDEQRVKRIKEITKSIGLLKKKMKDEIEKNISIRELDSERLIDGNVISVFESTLTRTLNIPTDTLTEDILVVRTYYFDILKSLISNGFIHNGEKYIYFSSSAGQIRTKKGVFIKESQWIKHRNSLTCGLTVDDVNAKGGANINKYLAYIALTNSASEQMVNFDINKCIVVPDLETKVDGVVDFIDDKTYEITRKNMSIPIEHTDGAGMILPSLSKNSFMIRLPFIKGLLIPFAFDDWVKEHKGSNSKIQDIYGKTWDIFDDDIQIIFTKSQFKMANYYNGWDDYRDKFIKYNCQAAMLNEENEEFGEVKLNYQMLQTLNKMTDAELKEISSKTIEDILELGTNRDVMLRVLGAKKPEYKKNNFQKALSIYPELLNDNHSKQVIKDVKKSMIKDAKAAKLKISGKYTFLCPDMYAFCEKLFKGIDNPTGLLGNGEVYCRLFDDGKLDLLRSPHLYREHAIRNNIKNDERNKWFITQGIYTSIFDNISKLLQFDNDGDQALVVDCPTFVSVAGRHMDGVVPLYYEMAVAEKQDIDSNNIYNGLISAFNANIGRISNDITKIWNSEDPNINVVKWLCAENNYIIDYAKTLYMPKRPEFADEEINKYIKSKSPHFFKYAKDKDDHKVEELNNSIVNRLENLIPNKRIQFKKVAGDLDYKLLMSNPRTKVDQEIIDKYIELDKSKRWNIGESNYKKGQDPFINKKIRDSLLEGYNDQNYVVDVLIKYLYLKKKSGFKHTLWDSFGDIVLHNLRKNLSHMISCESCGIRTHKKSNSTKYCNACAKSIKNKQNKKYYS